MIRELLNLSGRNVLITGAAGNLGRVIAETFAEIGANLILVDSPHANFDKLIESLKNYPLVSSKIIECDFKNENDRKKLCSLILEKYKHLNVLINNAAYVGDSMQSGWNVPFKEQSLSAWGDAMEVNITSVFHICKELFPLMMISEGASIINIGSIYGELGPDWNLYKETSMSNPAAYCASKGGLLQLTRWLSATLAPEIRVNAISPGGIARGQPTMFINRYINKTPLRRMATEKDLVGALVFLSTDLSSYVTGQNLVVDGGLSVI